MEVFFAEIARRDLPQFLTSGNDARSQSGHIVGDFSRSREPNHIALRVIGEVFQNPLEMLKTERLANDKRVKREAHDKRLFFSLLDHHIELIYCHFSKLRRRMAAI